MRPTLLRPTARRLLPLLLAMSGLLLAGCEAPGEEALAAGNEAFAAGDFAAAEAWYRSAIDQDADSAAAWINTGLARLRAEQPEAAIEAFRRGATHARGPLAARAFFDLGAAALRGGEVETAIEAFREALRLDPTDEDARHDLELAMALRDQQQEGEEGDGQESGEGEQEQDEQEEGESQESREGQEGQQGDEARKQEGEEGQDRGQEGQDQEGQGEEDPAGDEQQGPQPGQEGEEGAREDGAQAGAGDGSEASAEDGELTEEQAAALQEALEGMTPAQARRLLRALGGDSRSLQQVLQMRLPANGQRPDKDW